MVAIGAAGTARAEGPGIRLGDRLVLHPGIAAEFRYDSNIFFQDTNPTGAFVFRLLPTIDLATRPAQRGGNQPHQIDFRLHAGVDYNEILTTDSALARHRTVGVQAGGLLTILPYFPFTIDVFDNFVRLAQTPFSINSPNIERDTNELGVRFRIRPGGGRLEIDLSYVFGLDYFEARIYQDLNLFYHRAQLRASWKFLPKTAVWIEVSDTPNTYWNDGPGTVHHPDSYPLRAIAGLSGLLTAKLSVNLWAGYGNGFYQPLEGIPQTNVNPNTGIGGLDLRWKPSLLSQGALGYRHDFINSLLGSYYDLDSVFISWSQLIWRFTASARLSYSNIRYQGIETSAGLVDASGNPIERRTDNFVTLDVRVDYPFRDWLTLGVGYTLQSNSTPAALGSTEPNAVPLPLDYLKHEVWLRLAVLY